ncbi:MAG: helix-turn-helix domain-containing protein [Spirochaetaceae bacterium]|nr:helix-turn-helix domain-containing protein [Spirochaetaceae bacterium]
MNVFWTQFDEIINSRGISNKEVYSAIGVPQPSFSRWQRNDELPPVNKVIEMAQFFNVSIDYLLLGKQVKNRTILPSAITTIAHKLTSLKPEQLEAVSLLVDGFIAKNQQLSKAAGA